MMYNNYGYGYGSMMGRGYYATGAHWISWPFAFVGAVVALLLAVIWLVFVIWSLIDLMKHKPAHSLAWVFVIIFGHVMGPVGYYFIVVRDRKILEAKNKAVVQ